MKWGDLALNIQTFHQMTEPLAPLHLSLRSSRSLCVIAHEQSFDEFKKYESKGVQTLFMLKEFAHKIQGKQAFFGHMKLGERNLVKESDQQK